MAKTSASNEAIQLAQAALDASQPPDTGKPIGFDLEKMRVVEGEPLPLIWVDRASISVRTDVPVATIRFHTCHVERNVLFEACQIQMSIDLLKQLSTIINRTLQRYRPIETVDREPTAK